MFHAPPVHAHGRPALARGAGADGPVLAAGPPREVEAVSCMRGATLITHTVYLERAHVERVARVEQGAHKSADVVRARIGPRSSCARRHDA